jgi:CheY-like chemotaxis protein/two-component sensor histidine kinase
MDVSRITRGKLDLRKERMDLSAAVKGALEAVRPFLDEGQHQLTVSLPDERLFVEADPARLEQVLTNLLTNAGKYTPPGGQISLTLMRDADEAVVRIRDNGIGIRAEMLGRLFEMFQQADRIPGRISEGLGLGLTLVRSLVQMHGGSVTASSPGLDQGSEFVVRLPLLLEKDDFEQEVKSWPVRGFRPLRVLVTDDNVDAATSLAILLRLEGHEVRTAHDGKQAIEEAGAFHPQVAFLDIGLPGNMDGYEVARKLRQEAGPEQAVLVAMTGYGHPDDVARALAAGFDLHMTKPADLEAIQRLLVTVAERTG